MATAIKNLLPDVFKKKAWKCDLLRNWNHIMGPLCKKVRVEKILDDTLVLGVTNSCWMQELYLLSSLIIKTINQNLDKPRIKQIRFKKTGTYKKAQKPIKKTLKKKTITPRITIREKGALQHIKDPELADALESFLKRCYGDN